MQSYIIPVLIFASHLQALASNLCYSLDDGQFVARSDLVDAPSCTLARGAPISTLALTYDSLNNAVWSCSGDWVDQYQNPGHQASHHIRRRLGIMQDRHPVNPSKYHGLSYYQ